MTLRINPRRLATAAAACLWPAWLAAQDSTAASPGALRGRVIDARSLAPVSDVVVALTVGRDTVGDARADSGGFFVATLRTTPHAIPPQIARIVAHFQRPRYRVDLPPLDRHAATIP